MNNYKTTKLKNYKTTKQLNYLTAKQQNYKTTKLQIYKTTQTTKLLCETTKLKSYLKLHEITLNYMKLHKTKKIHEIT